MVQTASFQSPNSEYNIQLQQLGPRTLCESSSLLMSFDYDICLGSERSGEPDGGVQSWSRAELIDWHTWVLAGLGSDTPDHMLEASKKISVLRIGR
jgi:hypothetical protein